MLRECIYGECAHEQHVRRTLTLNLTLTLTHAITAYSVSGNVQGGPKNRPPTLFCLYYCSICLDAQITYPVN